MVKKNRKLSEEERALVKKARSLYDDEDFDGAWGLVQEGLEQSGHPRFKRFYGRLLVHQGRDDAASEVLTAIIEQIYDPGDWEIALVEGWSKAFLYEQGQFAHFPIPKCGSTSVRNLFVQLLGREPMGEGAHDYMKPYYQSFSRDEKEGWLKTLLVRDPIQRVRSFYHGNICGRDALVKDTGGRDHFYGLPTKPSYDLFIARLEDYRRVFVPVRQHLLPITQLVGEDKDYFDWVGKVEDISKLSKFISDHLGRELKPTHDMKSSALDRHQPLTPIEFEIADRYYSADYNNFTFD